MNTNKLYNLRNNNTMKKKIRTNDHKQSNIAFLSLKNDPIWFIDWYQDIKNHINSTRMEELLI